MIEWQIKRIHNDSKRRTVAIFHKNCFGFMLHGTYCWLCKKDIPKEALLQRELINDN